MRFFLWMLVTGTSSVLSICYGIFIFQLVQLDELGDIDQLVTKSILHNLQLKKKKECRLLLGPNFATYTYVSNLYIGSLISLAPINLLLWIRTTQISKDLQDQALSTYGPYNWNTAYLLRLQFSKVRKHVSNFKHISNPADFRETTQMLKIIHMLENLAKLSPILWGMLYLIRLFPHHTTIYPVYLIKDQYC